MEVPAPEVLLCDTSYLGHADRAARRPELYAHWPQPIRDRIASSVLAITSFTVAEIRVGWARSSWGGTRIAEAENRLKSFVLIPLDEAVLDEYVRLRTHCLSTGRSPSINDVWIAATAISQGIPLVTSDEEQARLPGLNAIYLPPPS